MGQLVDKKLHKNSSGNWIQSVDYRFDIRGRLRFINNSKLTNDVSTYNTNDLFGMDIAYEGTDGNLGFNWQRGPFG